MATATMATAAGAAALLYYTLNKKLISGITKRDDDDDDNASDVDNHTRSGIDRVSNRPIQAPATWLETISTLSETLRFTYSDTLGKWPRFGFWHQLSLKEAGKFTCWKRIWRER
ncbi:hypothetical protein ACH5RR_024318 [Cinchona calisaya]|uniref:Mono-/di-acylglycerol lipase N-terminal domain-containing protein n=1 Tax=Cinchona calisaya TaxID=153742 RepID=A0ABD2YYF0_9GENT